MEWALASNLGARNLLPLLRNYILREDEVMAENDSQKVKAEIVGGQQLRFEDMLAMAASIPGIRIDRDKYLRNELGAKFPQYVDEAIRTTPMAAGLTQHDLKKLSDTAIKWETAKTAGLSVASGIPGGFAMAGTIPADLAQYLAHVIRVVQKLAYLYGWDNLFDSEGEMDEDTKGILTLFVGVMMGAQGAGGALVKIAEQAQISVAKRISAKALTKGTIYPIVKKVAQYLGIQMTKEVFGKGVGKVIPIVGGVVSGGITLATFLPMANRLRRHLSGIAR